MAMPKISCEVAPVQHAGYNERGDTETVANIAADLSTTFGMPPRCCTSRRHHRSLAADRHPDIAGEHLKWIVRMTPGLSS